MSLRGGEQFFQVERRVFTLQNASNPTCIFGSSVLDHFLGVNYAIREKPPIMCASSLPMFWIISWPQLCNQGDVTGQLLIQNGEKK